MQNLVKVIQKLYINGSANEEELETLLELAQHHITRYNKLECSNINLRERIFELEQSERTLLGCE